MSRLEVLENCIITNKDITTAPYLPDNPDLTSALASRPNAPGNHISTIVSSYLNEENKRVRDTSTS